MVQISFELKLHCKSPVVTLWGSEQLKPVWSEARDAQISLDLCIFSTETCL